MMGYGWRGPGFWGWWVGDWRERVEDSIAEGVREFAFIWHWRRIKASFLMEKRPDRAPTAEFLKWVEHTWGLSRFACASGTLGDPDLFEGEGRIKRLFPEMGGIDPSARPRRCTLVRFRHRRKSRRTRLLAILAEGSFEPLYEDRCTIRQFLERARQRGLDVSWDQPLEEIYARAEVLPPCYDEAEGL
ncbi:MAG TPA: hypothetical protein VGE01_14060 [Fimbriimonas sp.]